MARAEYDDSLPFSGASSIPLCHITFPSTLFHQLVFHPPSRHLAIYFLVCLSALFFPNSYIILYWEFCFLPFSVHAQTNVTSVTLRGVAIKFANSPPCACRGSTGQKPCTKWINSQASLHFGSTEKDA